MFYIAATEGIIEGCTCRVIARIWDFFVHVGLNRSPSDGCHVRHGNALQAAYVPGEFRATAAGFAVRGLKIVLVFRSAATRILAPGTSKILGRSMPLQ